MKPKYFKQQSNYTCSLAILRSVLSSNGVNVSENDLVSRVSKDYGENFTNIWNPTIARIAREHNIPTHIYAKWLLFKDEVIEKAIKDYKNDPKNFNYKKYENSKDDNKIPEPLPITYKDMFLAYENGCQVTYGGLTEERIRRFIRNNQIIQTSIKLNLLYPGKKKAFHSILIYDIIGKEIVFHDPTHGEGLKASFERVINASTDVGAFMVYKTKLAFIYQSKCDSELSTTKPGYSRPGKPI